MKYLVLAVSRYSFNDEKTNELRAGASVIVLNDYRKDTEDSVGLKPQTVPLELEMFEKFSKSELPAYFDLDLTTRAGTGGKPTFVVIDAKHLRQGPALFEKPAQKAQ